MKTYHKEFYATRQDLLIGLQRLESEVALQYILRGMFPTPTPTVYFSAMDIPDLGISRHGHNVGEDVFLVTEVGTAINVEEIPQEKGGVLYDVGLMVNPAAFSFKPAGRFGEKTIIPGFVGTATGTSISLANCKRFWRELGKGFTKVEQYYVGPEAYRLLEQGWRLTPATQCPPDLNLRIIPE